MLVTGATGFLGSHLCRHLSSEGHEVVGLGSRQCDLREAGSLERAAPGAFDTIFHLAAWTQAGDFCLTHPGEQWIINQRINTNVLAWWQSHQPRALLVAMASSCCYDPAAPLREEHFFDGRPISSLFTYGMTKRMLHAGQLALARQYGLRHLCLIPSTLYGADYHLDGRQMHFIFDLIRKILEARRTGIPPQLWGDGHQKRELIHVGDFVEAMLRLSRTAVDELVNVGSGEEHSIREFAGMICDHVGYDASNIVYDESRYVGARSKVLDISKLRRLIPGFAPRPLREGLADTIDWFRRAVENGGPP